MENQEINCENCVYYDTDRTDQPCCSCVGGCNFESDISELPNISKKHYL